MPYDGGRWRLRRQPSFFKRTRCLVVLLAVVCMAGRALSAEDIPADGFPSVPPTEPRDALKTFRVLDGFRMELLAAEPLVADPVDMAYDENGRAYVVEMRGYPFPEKPDDPPTEPIGRVRLLEDEDGDGTFDRSDIFVDDLSWPTSVALWKGGVFVAAAPDIWYFQDTDGDRKADVRRKVYTGFSRYNVQAIMNNLKWGLDHRIYGAASGNGGNVVPADQPDAKPVSVSRRDFRFDPVGGALEAISGGARFGLSFDDWGNRFLCNIRNPVQHVVLPGRYLARNPFLAVTKTIHDAAQSGDQIPVYRISPPEPWREFRARRWVRERVNYPRSELVGAGFFTSSSGVTIYRGTAYPPEYRGNAFVADVAANVVHRETLSPDGVTFAARRADEKAEFVASTDNWFRPVNFVNAPDGTLHILDMYRETIEHPWSIPDDIRAKLDLSAGNDRGRIYRLVPPDFTPGPPPRLGSATTAELVRQLENPNAWWRETAHRLLFERQDQSAVAPLRRMLHDSEFPQARLHALWSLDGLTALTDDDLRTALADRHPSLREHAVALAELRLNESPSLAARVLGLAGDDAPRVRMQVAFTLGELHDTAAVVGPLAAIARRDAGDEWIRTAVLSSSGAVAADLLRQLIERPEFADRSGGLELVQQLALTAAAKGDETAAVVLQLAESLSDNASRDLQYALVTGLADGLQRRRKRLSDLTADGSNTSAAKLLDRAAQTAADDAAPLTARLRALELLRHDRPERVRDIVPPLLGAQQPREVQLAAVRALGAQSDPEVARILLDRWRQLTPPVRSEAVAILLSRAAWIGPFLDAVESGTVLPSQVPPIRRRLLTNSRDPDIKARAERFFGPEAPSPRGEVIAEYRPALARPSDAAAGEKVFRRDCTACHKLGNAGHEVGPALTTIRHRSPEEILIHILDPNREVSPNWLEYVVALKDGRVLTGTIVAETETGITLRRAEGAQDTVLRQEIDEIASGGKSLMPEGLEKKIAPQEMADLIAFLLKLE